MIIDQWEKTIYDPQTMETKYNNLNQPPVK